MEEKYEKYLPIGSVVLLKGATKRIMIIGYAVTAPESGDKIWDYIACLYPEGVAPEKNIVFQHDDIEKIFSLGYSDEEQKKFSELLKKAAIEQENKKNGTN